MPSRHKGDVEVYLYPYLIPALREGDWSDPRPGRFDPRKKTQYRLYRRLGGPRCWSGCVRKISPSPGFESRIVQPVASRLLYPAQWTHTRSFSIGYRRNSSESHTNLRQITPCIWLENGTGQESRL